MSARNPASSLRLRLPLLLCTYISLLILCSCFVSGAEAYSVKISDADELRQSCSGMWGGKAKRRETKIEVEFDKGASGTVASVIYEWVDFPKLGKNSPGVDFLGFPIKTYVCTAQAVQQKLCTAEELGQFIIDGERGTIVRNRIDFGAGSAEDKVLTYPVNASGYYCVASIPVTNSDSSNSTSHGHASFTGRVTFNNVFEGDLPAAEYPKLTFYFTLTALYAILGLAWTYLCVRHREELLSVQHYISGTIVFLIVEMAANWAYYNYLNSHEIDFYHISSSTNSSSVTATARFLLILTSILDAARNSISFFLLLIVAMGYGVVRPSIGPVMTRVRILTALHFVFGVLYSIGIVLIVIEAGGAWILAFVFPLAFTLSAFMMWILHSLNSTIEHLTVRKQTFKRMMFTKLYRVLVGAVVVIFAFFIISSLAFSQSGQEGFAPRSWPYRWFLLDGWLGLLYLAVFMAIAWIWRPTGSNLRLAMSDELATDEDAEAGDFEIDVLAQRDQDEGPPPENFDLEGTIRRAQGLAPYNAPRSGVSRVGAGGGVSEDDVVFEIGDDEDAETPRRPGAGAGTGEVAPRRSSFGEDARGGEHGEREGLMMSHEEENESRETLVPSRVEGRSKDVKKD